MIVINFLIIILFQISNRHEKIDGLMYDEFMNSMSMSIMLRMRESKSKVKVVCWIWLNHFCWSIHILQNHGEVISKVYKLKIFPKYLIYFMTTRTVGEGYRNIWLIHFIINILFWMCEILQCCPHYVSSNVEP